MGVTGRSGDPLLSQLHDEAQAGRRAAGRARPVREPHARAGRDRGRPRHRRRRAAEARRRTRLPMTRSCRRAPEHPWVSRGGLKLAAALDHFGFDPAGRVCLDVGASTGGFTEVLLARGAARVYAVDVGRGQLHARLRERYSASSRWKRPISARSIPRALAPAAGLCHDRRQLHLAQAGAAGARSAAAPARAPDRADQAAVRGRTEACEEGHRARSGHACGGVRGHRGVREHRSDGPSRASFRRRSKAGRGTRSF